MIDAAGNAQTVWFSPSDFTVWMPALGSEDVGPTGGTWINLADRSTARGLPEGSYQISPFVPNLKWDITKDPRIGGYQCEAGNCLPTNDFKVVDPQVVQEVRAGMRLAVTETGGTLRRIFNEEYPLPIAVAGKTGTAEYCDDVALQAQRCQFGSWPTHSWTLAFAPFEEPEIAIMAFEYNGGEGASVAGPVVGRLMQAYFDLKSVDLAREGG